MSTTSSEEDGGSGKPSPADFLRVAGEMEGFSLPVVAAALNYRKDISSLELSQRCSKRNKIVALLVGWRKENEDTYNWEALIKCLENLNNRELTKKIRIIHDRRGGLLSIIIIHCLSYPKISRRQ